MEQKEQQRKTLDRINLICKKFKTSSCVSCGGADEKCIDCKGEDRIYYLTPKNYWELQSLLE